MTGIPLNVVFQLHNTKNFPLKVSKCLFSNKDLSPLPRSNYESLNLGHRGFPLWKCICKNW